MKYILFIFLTLALLLTSCNKKPDKVLKHDNSLNISFMNDPLTLDSRKNSDPTSCQMLFLLFEGLVQLETDGTVTFNLATSIDITKNRMKYTFHLRDAFWSDGHKISAHDFVYAWKKILDPSFPSINAFFLYCIQNAKKAKNDLIGLDKVGIYAPDDNTLVVKLEYPTPYFLEMLTFCTFFPIPKHIAENNPDWPTKCLSPLVSNGPFVLVKWQQNNKITLAKNPSYWNKKNVSLDKVTIHIIPDPQTNLQLFQNNELDFIGALYNPIPLDAISFLNNSQEYFTKDFMGTEYCFFNSQCFPLNNLNIRKALYYAIDREQIVENITQTGQKVAYGLIPPQLKKGVSSKHLPMGSKELALQYFYKGLSELGITRDSFPKLTFTFYNSKTNLKIAQYLQEAWQSTLDLSFKIEGIDVKTFLDKINNKNFHFCLMSIYAQYNDAYNYLERFIHGDSPKNYCGYENIKYQNIVAISNETLTETARLKLIDKAESLLLSELPCGPLFHYANAYLKHPQMKGLIITPLSTINLSKVTFE